MSDNPFLAVLTRFEVINHSLAHYVLCQSLVSLAVKVPIIFSPEIVPDEYNNAYASCPDQCFHHKSPARLVRAFFLSGHNIKWQLTLKNSLYSFLLTSEALTVSLPK
ncbi:hypothetical protein HBA94_16060 [Ochrobactrum sp. GRS2]|nr:hypothetical protein [Ochrobactrum sp. GRS2]